MTKNRKDKKQFTSPKSSEKIQQNLFMHGGGKPHYNWKLDDERPKRSAPPSVQASPITTYNNSPGYYMHEKTQTGIINQDILQMVTSSLKTCDKYGLIVDLCLLLTRLSKDRNLVPCLF